MPDSVTADNAPIEVEFRCHFENPEKAGEVLPFLASCLNRRVPWSSTFFGRELFESGKLLRISELVDENGNGHYLTWKGPDTGKFANIRREISENITAGVRHSSILSLLEGGGSFPNRDGIIRELERLGHRPFMSWQGIDRYGYYEPFKTNVKLMYCEYIKWPWLVELEKMAATAEEASRCQDELEELCSRFKLDKYLVKEEPPALLYENIFSSRSKRS
jgi:adenylate cyclase class IV